MIIKVIVDNQKDFDKLKDTAYYCSERTKVMCFDLDSSNPLFPCLSKYMKTVENEDDISYIVTYNNGIYILSEDKELAVYLGSTVNAGMIKVSVVEWWKIALLLRHNTIIPDENFKERFPAMTKSGSNVNETKTWTMNTKFRKANKWNFKEFADKTLKFDGEKGIKIASAKFLTDSCLTRDYSIITGFVSDITSDKKEILFTSETDNVYKLQVKGWPFRFNSDVWQKNKKISFYCTSKNTEIINPVIIPKCLNINPKDFNDYINEFGYLSNRTCPTELLNRLKAEISIRLFFSGEKI